MDEIRDTIPTFGRIPDDLRDMFPIYKVSRLHSSRPFFCCIIRCFRPDVFGIGVRGKIPIHDWSQAGCFSARYFRHSFRKMRKKKKVVALPVMIQEIG